MPRPELRDNVFASLGGTHAYKTGTAHTTAQSVVAAPSTGLAIRIKAFRCVASTANAADTATNDLWLSDGSTTPLLGLLNISAIDLTAGAVNVAPWDTGHIVLPGFGVKLTAAQALTIDATAIDANLKFQLDVYYDVVDAKGIIQ